MKKLAIGFALCCVVARPAQAMLFNEIMYHPSGEDEASYEWVELHNDYAMPLDIGGWSFSKGIHYTFPDDTVMPGYSYLVVCANVKIMERTYGIAASELLGPFEGRLDNRGERIALVDRMGAVIDRVRYSDREPWPAGADGTGFCLALVNPDLANDESENWAVSLQRLGTPGEPNGFVSATTTTPMPVVINEFLANTDDDTFVELINNSGSAVDIGLAYLSDAPENLTKYRIAQRTSISPWGYMVFTGTQMGFQLPPSDAGIYLTTSDGERIIDACAYGKERKGMSGARCPDGAGRWYTTPTPTPGKENEISVKTSIVINEIMYHPYLNRKDLEYIELYNRGSETVDLSGWSFADGVDFVFRLGTTLGPGEYLVVCRSQRDINKMHRIQNAIGNYTGSLENGGERIELVDVMGNVVDEVRYAPGGRWPIWAAGWGSSLELIDPGQDNSIPSAWAASDDRAWARWSHVQYSADLTGGESEFHFFLMHRGECLIDDISVTRDGKEYISNGSFESGTSGWKIEGNHIQSTIYMQEAQTGSRCLKIVATGRGDTGANRIECDTANRLSGAAPYTVSFWVKWQRGINLIYTGTHSQGLAKASRFPMPARRGTPGKRNSVYCANLGPVMFDVKQHPIVPRASDPVQVTARISGSDGVSSVTLYYKGDYDGSYKTVQMYDLGLHGDGRPGDGLHAGEIPARGSSNLMRFYIEAKDTRSAAGRFPAKDGTYCLYQIENSSPSTKFPVYRILLTHEADQELRSRNRLSNELADCTFELNNSEIFYNCGLRTRGSGWTRGNHPSSHYRVRLPADQPLRGVWREINLDWRQDNTRQKDRLVQHLLRQLGGVPTSYQRYVHVRFNDWFAAIAEEPQKVDGDYVRFYWPDDAAGTLFKVDDHFEWTDGWSHSHRDAYLIWQGEDGEWEEKEEKEKYRWNCKLRTNEKQDNYSDFLELVHLMDTKQTSDSNFAYTAENALDVDEWLKVLSVRLLVGDWDTLGYNRGKNAYIYRPYHKGDGTANDPPRYGRWVLLPWDSDLTFESNHVNDPIISDKFPSIKRMLETPRFQRQYYSYFMELVDGPFSRAEMDPIVDIVYQAFSGEPGAPSSPSSIKSFVSSRSSVIRSRIPRAQFAITTNAGEDLEVEGTGVRLEGTAPVTARTMMVSINGGESVPLSPTWKDATHWQTTLRLTEHENNFELTGQDPKGSNVGTASITVIRHLSATADSDGDGLSDRDEDEVYDTQYLKPDTDEDGLTDGDEVHLYQTSPIKADSDEDTMPDGWEVHNALDPLTDDSAGDPDKDGLTNAGEFQHSADPNNSDTDGDGMNDGAEVFAGTIPGDDSSLFTIVDIEQNSAVVSVDWTSVAGREYAVYESDDLVNWRLLKTVTASGDTSSFTDLDAPSTSARFYRIEVLPSP